MIKVSLRRLTLLGAAALFSASALHAQDAPAVEQTPLDRQLARVELSVVAAGEFTSSTNGNTIGTSTTTGTNQPVADNPSKTVGYLATLSYTKSPYIGLEFNYGQARYDQNYVYASASLTGATPAFLSIQQNAAEVSFGYLVHTRHTYYGVQPFASAGAGTIAFRPTKNGGEGASTQARAAYYYNIGAQLPLYGSHFGARVSFRQVFALAPDFQETYLRDHQHSVDTQPTIGFYLRF